MVVKVANRSKWKCRVENPKYTERVVVSWKFGKFNSSDKLSKEFEQSPMNLVGASRPRPGYGFRCGEEGHIAVH